MQHGEAIPRLSKLRKDHAAMGTNRDTGGRTVCRRDNELGRHEASRRDLANPAAPDLAKPEVAVGPCDNAVGLAVRGRNRKLGDGPVDGNSAGNGADGGQGLNDHVVGAVAGADADVARERGIVAHVDKDEIGGIAGVDG